MFGRRVSHALPQFVYMHTIMKVDFRYSYEHNGKPEFLYPRRVKHTGIDV